MPLDFPDNPTFEQTFNSQGQTWIWDGEAWIIFTPENEEVTPFVLKEGDQMSGPLDILVTGVSQALGIRSDLDNPLLAFLSNAGARRGGIQSQTAFMSVLLDGMTDMRIPGQALTATDSIVTRALGDTRYGSFTYFFDTATTGHRSWIQLGPFLLQFGQSGAADSSGRAAVTYRRTFLRPPTIVSVPTSGEPNVGSPSGAVSRPYGVSATQSSFWITSSAGAGWSNVSGARAFWVTFGEAA